MKRIIYRGYRNENLDKYWSINDILLLRFFKYPWIVLFRCNFQYIFFLQSFGNNFCVDFQLEIEIFIIVLGNRNVKLIYTKIRKMILVDFAKHQIFGFDTSRFEWHFGNRKNFEHCSTFLFHKLFFSQMSNISSIIIQLNSMCYTTYQWSNNYQIRRQVFLCTEINYVT